MGQIKNIKLHIVADIKKSKKKTQCLSSKICHIHLLKMRSEFTSLLDWFHHPTRISWMSSVPDVTRSLQCSVMHRRLCCVCLAVLYCVNPLVVVQDLLKDAVSARSQTDQVYIFGLMQ